jgi:hypothetical protein
MALGLLFAALASLFHLLEVVQSSSRSVVQATLDPRLSD